MAQTFPDKAAAREHVWDRLQAEKAARFPFPPHGRIPNFKGAEAAARRLLAEEPWASARRLKVNPDAPQRPLRQIALERGIEVYVPTPRLRAGFKRLDPARIPQDELKAAASLSKGDRWAEPVVLADLPPLDAVVTGSVAVTRAGKRCGKGHGYGDIEYAILRELGQPPLPVATTVHLLQIVDDFPADANDLPIGLIVTPDETIRVTEPPPAPDGIAWDALPADALQEMPVLAELKNLTGAG